MKRRNTSNSIRSAKRIPTIRIVIYSVLILFLLVGLYNGLDIRHYQIDSDSVKNPVRIALITDLHSCKYGEEEQTLIHAIASQEPDLVMMAGDIFDDVLPNDYTESLIQGIAEAYPCYYVTGNHEYWGGKAQFEEQMSILNQYGVHILSGEMETITVHGTVFNICGVDDPDKNLLGNLNRNERYFEEQLQDAAAISENENYTILLSHRPEAFEAYAEYGFDLVLCGHAHGGQWRIPFLLNGLYAPNQGIFPEYAGGQYKSGQTTMIVSRGLARESTRVPRFYNRPELVIIDLQ